MVLFKNTIKYNKRILRKAKYLNSDIMNLSSILFSDNPLTKKCKANDYPIFNLEKIMPFEKVVIVKKIKEVYHIVVHPEIEKLAPIFECYHLNSTATTSKRKINYIVEKLKERYQRLLNNIEEFCKNRALILNNIEIFELSNLTTEENVELTKIVKHLQAIYLNPKIQFFDYQEKGLKKQNYEQELNYIYNYRQLRNVLLTLVNNKTEYIFSTDKLKYLEEQKQELLKEKQMIHSSWLFFNMIKVDEEIVKNHLNNLNDSPYFAIEYLRKFYQALEEEVRKEFALNNLIYNIILKNILYIEIRGSKLVKIRPKKINKERTTWL